MKKKIIPIFLMVICFSLALIASALPSIPTTSPNYFNCAFDPLYQENGLRNAWCNLTDSSNTPILNANISHSTYDTNDWYKNGLMSEKGWFIGYQPIPNAYNISDNNFTVYSSRTIDATRRAHIKYGAFTYPFEHLTQNFSILLKAGSGATTLRVMVCNDTYANDVMGNTPVNLSRTSLYSGCQLAGLINATEQGINYNNWTWGTVDVTNAYNNMTKNQSGAMNYAIHLSSYDITSVNPVGWSIADTWMHPIHNETKEVFTLNESDLYTPNEVIIPTGCDYTFGTNMTGSVLHLRLNEASGTLEDVSCQSNNGTVYDSPSLGETGLFVNATDFTSNEDSRIVIADDDSLDLNETGTLMTWINLNSLVPYSGFIHKGQERSFSDEAYSFQFLGGGNTLRFYLTDGSSSMTLDAASALDTDKWYHVVATWNATTKKIYINGVEDVTTESAILPQTTAGSLQIGSQLNESYNSNFGHFSIDGKLDEVNIFNRTLTADEIGGFYKKGLNYFTPDERVHNGTTEVYGNSNLLFVSDTVTINETNNFPIFDSNDDYLEPLNLTSWQSIGGTNTSFTTCQYFKRSEIGTTYRRLEKWESPANNGALSFYITRNDITFWIREKTGTGCGYRRVNTAGDLVADTEWHHVCGVVDRENEEMYIVLDGEKVVSRSIADNCKIRNVTEVVLGRDTISSGSDNGFRGQLAQYMLHNDSHTEGEIKEGINTAWWSLAIGEQVTDNVYAIGELINDTTYFWEDEPGHTPIAFTKIYNMNNGSAKMIYNVTNQLYHSTYYTNEATFAPSQGLTGINFTTFFEYNSTVNDTQYYYTRGVTNATCDINVNWNWADKTGQYQLARVNWTIDSNIPLIKRNMYLCEDGYSDLSECDVYTGDSPTRHKRFTDYGTATVVCEVQNDYMSEPYYANDTLDIGCWSAYGKYDGTEPSLELESTLYVCPGTHTLISELNDAAIRTTDYAVRPLGEVIFDGGNERGGHANSSDYRMMFWAYDVNGSLADATGGITLQNGDIGFFFEGDLINSYYSNYKFINMGIAFDLEHNSASNFSIINNTFTECGIGGEDPIYITGKNIEIKHNYFNALASDGDKNIYCYGCSNVTLEQNYYADISDLAIYSSGNTRNVSTVLGNFSCEIGDSGSQYPYRDFTNLTGDYLKGAKLYGEITDSYPCTSQVTPVVVADEETSSIGGGSVKINLGSLESIGGIYSGNLSYGWKMIFEYNGENHTIRLRNINRNEAEVRFEVHSKKINVLIKEGKDKKIDLDDDGKEDIILSLNKIFENMKVNMGLEIIDKDSVITEGAILESPEEIEKHYFWIWAVLIGIVIISICIGFKYINKKNKKKPKDSFHFLFGKKKQKARSFHSP